jgi:cytochrome oxidase assembly protein ShyY1
VYSINPGQVSQVTGVPLAGSYLQLVDNQPGGLGVIPLPHLDAGPFLSYGIQWIAFGIIAPIGLGYFIVAEVKARRREKAVAPEAPAATPQTAEEKLADRYGRRR